MVKISPSKAGGAGSIPGQGAKIPYASCPKKQNMKHKQYCNKLNTDLRKERENLPAMQETQIPSLDQEDTLERECQSILYSKAKVASYSRYLLTSYFCILILYDEKDTCFGC